MDEPLPLLRALSEKICAFDSGHVSPLAVERATAGIIDTIGVALGGISEPCVQILLKTPGVATAAGPCVVFGTARRTSALEAALVNGTASHALDFDDFSGVLGGHQSAPLVPALLSLAEEHHLTGEKLLLAYLVGVESEIRMARAALFHHYDKGWHPTVTLGIFGTAAACGYLLGLDPKRMASALAIAASLASGIKANFGTMTKPLHVGQCGRNGMLAVLLAQGGFDANPIALEHKQGFFNVFNGPDLYEPGPLLADWGTPLEIEDPSIALKQFPCCGSTHPAVMMMLALRREEGVTADNVTSIEIMPHQRRLKHTDKPHPETALEAKFSVQYAVARVLLEGTLRLNDFEHNAFREPAVRKLLALTSARPHPEMSDTGPQQWGAEVRVTLTDGREVSRRVENLVGRGGDDPMRPDELWAKFSDCAGRILPKAQLTSLFGRLQSINRIADVNEITRLAAAG